MKSGIRGWGLLGLTLCAISGPAQTPNPTSPAPKNPAPPATNPAPTTAPPAAKTPPPPDNGRITNVFTDQDIRQVITEMASTAGVTVIADSSVKAGEISVEFKDDTIEDALEKLSYVAGLLWKKKGNIYLVTTGAPDAPLFGEFASTKVYIPRTQPAESLFALLARNYTTYAQLDKSANMISICAPEKLMNAIWESLVAADGPRRQFIVEALVTELKDTKGTETGFSWSWKNFAQGDDLGLSYAKASFADIAKLKALISTNRATLRANPSIMATEGREASLTVGTETYFSIVTGNTAYSSVQLQRINTGITLRLTGFVGPDGTINLHLQPEVSDAAAPVNGSPSTTIRRVDTYFRVEPGQTLAIGGLIQDTDSTEVQKIPVFGDIPLLGNLFRSSKVSKKRTEVVILITPRLLPFPTPLSP